MNTFLPLQITTYIFSLCFFQLYFAFPFSALQYWVLSIILFLFFFYVLTIVWVLKGCVSVGYYRVHVDSVKSTINIKKRKRTWYFQFLNLVNYDLNTCWKISLHIIISEKSEIGRSWKEKDLFLNLNYQHKSHLIPQQTEILTYWISLSFIVNGWGCLLNNK